MPPHLARQIGLRYDELYCSSDKIARCVELGIDVLVDDSPQTLTRAVEAGIVAATIVHPWNEDVCETEDVIAARDWTSSREARPCSVAAPAGRASAQRRGARGLAALA